MTKRTTVAAVALAASAALVGGATLPSASASSTQNVMHLVAHQTGTQGRAHFTGSDRDTRHGKTVGYDVITGYYDQSANKAYIHVAFALKGGLIEGRVAGNNSSHGPITGGTGIYRGITGRITAINGATSKTDITLRYTLP